MPVDKLFLSLFCFCKNKEEYISDLIDLNSELLDDINSLEGDGYIPSDELYHEPEDESNIYIETIQEPIQEEISDKLENKILIIIFY